MLREERCIVEYLVRPSWLRPPECMANTENTQHMVTMTTVQLLMRNTLGHTYAYHAVHREES